MHDEWSEWWADKRWIYLITPGQSPVAAMAQLHKEIKRPMSCIKHLSSIPWTRRKADSPLCLSPHPRNLQAHQKKYFPSIQMPEVHFFKPQPYKGSLPIKKFFPDFSVPGAFCSYFLQNMATINFFHKQRNPSKYSKIHRPWFKKFWTMGCPHGRILCNHLMGYGTA